MQRSIFILPGSSPFVNAMGVLPAPEMQRLHLPLAGHSRSTPKAWPIKIRFGLFILRRIRPRSGPGLEAGA